MDQIRKPQPAPVQSREPAHNGGTAHYAPRKSAKKLVATFLVVVLVALLASGAAYAVMQKKTDVGLVGVNKDQYQALFLTNGQVYFGKLKAADSKTIEIKDIYYLQVQQAVQPKDNKQTTEQEQGETQLVKLGQELHGPSDEMYIDRGQVLFWENLKDEGKVVTAIKEYKKQ